MESLTVNGITWHHAELPEEADLLRLQRAHRFHKLDIEDCLSENERPKIEEYPEYLFFIVHLPVCGRSFSEFVRARLPLVLVR